VFRRRKDGAPRRGTPAEWVFVGLANPGVEFQETRHNVGGATVEALARRLGATLRVDPRMRAKFAEITTTQGRIVVAVPTTYMNESGAAVVPLVRRAGIDDLARLLVVHDELDLSPGRLQLKVDGGLAGHNGLRSVSSALGTDGYARLRIGIGKPPSKDRGVDWVTARPSGAVRLELEASVERAVDVLERVLADGIEVATAGLAGQSG
jgi:peptidyl-tRNA hydrolase, PTH1 family